jgi:hypothetical protein
VAAVKEPSEPGILPFLVLIVLLALFILMLLAYAGVLVIVFRRHVLSGG